VSEPIRVLLVDDQTLFRESLGMLLAAQPGLEVVGEAANGAEALARVAALRPDVVLMDLRMPVLDGVAATRQLRTAFPAIQVIVLTTFDDDADVFAALGAGALGYLLKDVSGDTLVAAVRAAARGEAFLQPHITTKVVQAFSQRGAPPPPAAQPLAEPLSARELEILHLLAGGATNREIAAALVLAEGTVKNHLTSILGKLGARDRAQAVLLARDLGLI
jgi:DNA-binding NarL/FixJ family response regulator